MRGIEYKNITRNVDNYRDNSCTENPLFKGPFDQGRHIFRGIFLWSILGHILCGDTINVMHLLIHGFNAHGLDMKIRRKSVSTSVITW